MRRDANFENEKKRVNDELFQIRQRKNETLAMKIKQIECQIAHNKILDEQFLKDSLELEINIEETKKGFALSKSQIYLADSNIKNLKEKITEVFKRKEKEQIPNNQRIPFLELTKNYFSNSHK